MDEIISIYFSDHNDTRLDINYREKTVKNTNAWRLNNKLLNNQEVTKKSKGKSKKYLETNDSENTMTSPHLHPTLFPLWWGEAQPAPPAPGRG